MDRRAGIAIRILSGVLIHPSTTFFFVCLCWRDFHVLPVLTERDENSEKRTQEAVKTNKNCGSM